MEEDPNPSVRVVIILNAAFVRLNMVSGKKNQQLASYLMWKKLLLLESDVLIEI